MSSALARWFPTQLRLPDGRLLRRVYVVVARGGEWDGVTAFNKPDEVVWRSALDWGSQPALPRTQRAAARGVELRLADGGLAIATPGGSCRCGALGRWAGPVGLTTTSV